MFCWARAKKLKLAEFGRRNGAGPRVRGATPFAAACCILTETYTPYSDEASKTAGNGLHYFTYLTLWTRIALGEDFTDG